MKKLFIILGIIITVTCCILIINKRSELHIMILFTSCFISYEMITGFLVLEDKMKKRIKNIISSVIIVVLSVFYFFITKQQEKFLFPVLIVNWGLVYLIIVKPKKTV